MKARGRRPIACVAGGIWPAKAFVLVAKPWTQMAKPWEDIGEESSWMSALASFLWWLSIWRLIYLVSSITSIFFLLKWKTRDWCLHLPTKLKELMKAFFFHAIVILNQVDTEAIRSKKSHKIRYHQIWSETETNKQYMIKTDNNNPNWWVISASF